MLHIYTSSRLSQLNQRLLELIQDPEIWKNPFESPIAVFSDAKIEQWFKMYWMKNSSGKSPVLMNLQSRQLESFLFEEVGAAIPRENENFFFHKNSSTELIRDLIVAKLIEKDDEGKYFLETLNAPEVTDYIKDGNIINEVHLFDFAETMAAVFNGYETTRPDGFIPIWTSGRNYFNHQEDDRKKIEDWQRKLYCALFNEDLAVDRTHYTTLARLAEKNRNANGGRIKFFRKDVQVFIYGFVGMGQLYKKLIQEYAKTNDVYFFMQNDDSENHPLTRKWARHGKENFISLSKSGDAVEVSHLRPLDVADSGNQQALDSRLHILQDEIFTDTARPENFPMASDFGISLTAVPSRLREIEVVHSEICKLIEENKNLSHSDFLVLASSIQDYRVPIMQVFEQARNNDRKFPYLPYVIADYSSENSLLADAMRILLDVLNKNALHRNDFFELLRNPVVQSVRNLPPEEISSWAEWVSSLNAYRDRETSPKEWVVAARRLMLARLTDNLVINRADPSSPENYLPYGNMASQNNESLDRFIECIDSLESWKKNFSNVTSYSSAQVDSFVEHLNSWIKADESLPEELKNEKTVYAGILGEIKNYRNLLDSGKYESVNARALGFSLLEAAQSAQGSSNRIFTGGITFATFAPNRAIQAKYVFLIGFDSKSFPGVDSENVLDLRSGSCRLPDDDSVPGKNKNSFWCQLMATGEKLFVSYVNKDLQKDEDFYRSSVVNDLFEAIGVSRIKDVERFVTIDETRDWPELFTQRSFSNKRNYERLQEHSPSIHIAESHDITEKNMVVLPERVTVSSIKSFLQDPFVFSVRQLLDANDDDSEEEKIEFEPIRISSLEKAALLKDYVRNSLNAGTDAKTTTMEQYLKNTHALPEGVFGRVELNAFQSDACSLVNLIRQDLDGDQIVFDEQANLDMEAAWDGAKVHAGKCSKWTLTGSLCGYAWTNGSLKVIDMTLGKSKDDKHYLSMYVSALILAASGNTGQESVNVDMRLYHKNSAGKFTCSSKTITLNRESAAEILNDIYKAAYVEKFSKCTPINLLTKDFENIYKYKGTITGENGEWKYFAKAKLFDVLHDVGFTYGSFSDAENPNEWQQAVNHQKKLILYIK